VDSIDDGSNFPIFLQGQRIKTGFISIESY
jgi:hypothetical protein